MKKISVVLIMTMASCTPSAPLTSARWSGDGAKPQYDLGESSLQNQKNIKSSGEDIKIFEQYIGSFRVEGSSLKLISRKEKGDVFQSYSLTQKVKPFLVLKAENLDRKKESAWQLLLSKNSEIRSQKLQKPLEVVFITSTKLKPVIEALTEAKNGNFILTYFDLSGTVISSKQAGSQLAETIESPALAYPKGPKKSALSNVLLLRDLQPIGLASPLVELNSASPEKIVVNQNIAFQPNDSRFDQVQAFYFSSLILKWFHDQFQVVGLNKIAITTQVGFPEKTNTAFYFQNQIRLGTGDDIVFSHMAWDPSIVMHETSHAVIDRIAQLPFQDEGGSINEGFADLFTTFYLDNPLLAENSYQKGPFKRSVDSLVKLSEKTGGLYHDSAIVSGFFWALKDLIGSEKTLQLAFRVLNRLGPQSDFKDFIVCLKEQTQEILSPGDLKKANQLMLIRELQ